jgi:hypothetical protein
MNVAYISALAALVGSAIGGLTSFATSLSTLRVQSRAHHTSEVKTKREALYGQFIDEASQLYADALQNQQEKVSNLVILRLHSPPQIIEAADKVVQVIVDTYLAPNKTFPELRDMVEMLDAELLQFGFVLFELGYGVDAIYHHSLTQGSGGRYHA